MTASVKRRELLIGLAALPWQRASPQPRRIRRVRSASWSRPRPAAAPTSWRASSRSGDRAARAILLRGEPAGGGNNIAPRWRRVRPPTATRCHGEHLNTINNALYQKLNYNFIADFAPVANVMGSRCWFWCIRRSKRKRRRADRARQSRPRLAQPRLGGIGSTGHMSAELFQMMAGIKLTHVPYRGEAPALTDLIGGQAQ